MEVIISQKIIYEKIVEKNDLEIKSVVGHLSRFNKFEAGFCLGWGLHIINNLELTIELLSKMANKINRLTLQEKEICLSQVTFLEI